MKFLTDLKSLEGKTIKAAKLVDCDEDLAILFTDDTCAYFHVRHYGDSYELELSDDVDLYQKHDAGIISEVNYELEKARKDEERRIRYERSDRETLAKLKAKYEAPK